MLEATPTTPRGSLVVTGVAHPARRRSPADGLLLAAAPGTLAPGWARLFGDHAGGFGGSYEVTAGVAPHAGGFFVTLYTSGNCNSGYLRLISTDGAGRTPCSMDWAPPHRGRTLRAVHAPLTITPWDAATLPSPAVTVENRQTKSDVCQ